MTTGHRKHKCCSGRHGSKCDPRTINFLPLMHLVLLHPASVLSNASDKLLFALARKNVEAMLRHHLALRHTHTNSAVLYSSSIEQAGRWASERGRGEHAQSASEHAHLWCGRRGWCGWCMAVRRLAELDARSDVRAAHAAVLRLAIASVTPCVLAGIRVGRLAALRNGRIVHACRRRKLVGKVLAQHLAPHLQEACLPHPHQFGLLAPGLSAAFPWAPTRCSTTRPRPMKFVKGNSTRTP